MATAGLEVAAGLASQPPRHSRADLRFSHTKGLPLLLRRLGISVLVSTYQAGRVVTLAAPSDDQLKVDTTSFPQAMGLARWPKGLVVGSQSEIWQLYGNADVASRFEELPVGRPDMAFMTTQSHFCGPVEAHEISVADPDIWFVNTHFNCLCTLEAPFSFRVRWKPPFINQVLAGDRCHLNGLAMNPVTRSPSHVTALAESNELNGWRVDKQNSGVIIDVQNNEIVARGLCMPHSPRLIDKSLYFLNSGKGELCRLNLESSSIEVLARLNGYLRGLDIYNGLAFVGMSKARDQKTFGDTPITSQPSDLNCGMAVVNLNDGKILATFAFQNFIDEVFSVLVLPGYTSPALFGPNPQFDSKPPIWWAAATEELRL